MNVELEVKSTIYGKIHLKNVLDVTIISRDEDDGSDLYIEGPREEPIVVPTNEVEYFRVSEE